jgi:histidine ammonia-lyase
MENTQKIELQDIKISDIENLLKNNYILELGEDVKYITQKTREFLENKIRDTNLAFYGINTGFGSLCNVVIPSSLLMDLQRNLVLSHACGTGELVPEKIVKIILYLKIRNLSLGYSGVTLNLLDLLSKMYNHNILPVIYQQGSLGASGDLAPLAHLSLPLIGEGSVWNNGIKKPSKEVFAKEGLSHISLQAKEGLALLNGTQFSTAYGVYSIIESQKLIQCANTIAAMSCDAFLCSTSPFDSKLHEIRKQPGQIHIAKQLRKLLEGSEINNTPKEFVQDPYAFRCIPQVHGASYDSILNAKNILENEINAVTDNPIIFADQDEIISGGNFHAQPIALVLDYLAIALAELGSISERRTYQLISGTRYLPPFLTKNPGVNSGFMIPQYTTASIVSQNKQLCTPASVDSIVSSNGQEDHVSMAANAATKLYKVVENLWTILAIEMMVACQALEFRRPGKSSETLEIFHSEYRKNVSALENDRLLSDDIEKTRTFLLYKAWGNEV